MLLKSKCLISSISVHLLLLLLLLIFFSGIAFSQTNVTYLPGYDGELPFKLETGYIGVGTDNASQLFYYFVESERSPSEDPFMLWLTGGPGCSVLSAFFYESGPVTFDYVNFNGSFPTLIDNPYTWTKTVNILYVDAPVGTGFSYSLNQENYYIDDEESAAQTYEFLKKFLIAHPQFLKNNLIIGGDSYSGIPLPIIVQNIITGNLDGDLPYLNLKAYVLGNPKTDNFLDDNSRIPFSHRLTLISDELYTFLNESCDGNFVDIEANNTECVVLMEQYDQLVLQINLMHVLEPICQTALPRLNGTHQYRRSLYDDNPEYLLESKSVGDAFWCRDYNYILSALWANDRGVREAINVAENTTGVWKRCNSTIAYTKTVTTSVPYHLNFSANTDLHVLIYSGDHDLSVTHIGTSNWIRSLNLTTSEAWRAWYVDGQVAGYTQKFLEGDYTLIFATVKGAGHVAPEYKAKECYEMLNRWLAYFPL